MPTAGPGHRCGTVLDPTVRARFASAFNAEIAEPRAESAEFPSSRRQPEPSAPPGSNAVPHKSKSSQRTLRDARRSLREKPKPKTNIAQTR